MKLAVKDVARITGLSVATVRSYASRMKLGKREGRYKVFSMKEAKLIDSGKLPPSPRANAGKKKPKRKS
jgi:hypothetical protein